MNIHEALLEAQKILTRRQRKTSTPLFDSEVLLAFVLKKSFEYLYAHPEATLSQSQLLRFHRLLQRRKRGVPVAYLTGVKEFFGLEFCVNPHVLIPRPDTEILVERALEEAQKLHTLSILEIGTGSGCIAITLKKYLPNVRIIATDVSQKALAVARKNAKRYNLSITFLRSDLFSHPRLRSQKFDLVVSNPPYLSRRVALKESLKHEPSIALSPDSMTPRAFFERILNAVLQHLNPSGMFLFEIGNNQQPMIERLVRTYPNSRFVFSSDLSEQPRVTCIQKED